MEPQRATLTPASASFVSRIETSELASLGQLVRESLHCPVCKDLGLGSRAFLGYARVLQHAGNTANWAKGASSQEHRALLEATEKALQARKLSLTDSGVFPLDYLGQTSLPFHLFPAPGTPPDHKPTNSSRPGILPTGLEEGNGSHPEHLNPDSHRPGTLSGPTLAGGQVPAPVALSHSQAHPTEGQQPLGAVADEGTANGTATGTGAAPSFSYLAAAKKPPDPAGYKAPQAHAGSVPAAKPKLTATTLLVVSRLASLDLETLQREAMSNTECPTCRDLGLGAGRVYPRFAGVLQHAAMWGKEEGAAEHKGLLASTETALQGRQLRIGHEGVAPLAWPKQLSIHFKGANWKAGPSSTQPHKPDNKPAVSQAGAVQPAGSAFKYVLPSKLDKGVAQAGILLIRKFYKLSLDNLLAAAQNETLFCPLCRRQDMLRSSSEAHPSTNGTSSTSTSATSTGTGAPSASDPAPSSSKAYRWLPALLHHCFTANPNSRFYGEHMWLAGEIDRLLAHRGLRADQAGVYRGAPWESGSKRKGFPLPSDHALVGTAYHFVAHVPSQPGPGSGAPVPGQPAISDPARSGAGGVPVAAQPATLDSGAGPGSGWGWAASAPMGGVADTAQGSGGAAIQEPWRGLSEVADVSFGTESAQGFPGSSAVGVLPQLAALPGNLHESLAGLLRIVEESEKVHQQRRKQLTTEEYVHLDGMRTREAELLEAQRTAMQGVMAAAQACADEHKGQASLENLRHFLRDKYEALAAHHVEALAMARRHMEEERALEAALQRKLEGLLQMHCSTYDK